MVLKLKAATHTADLRSILQPTKYMDEETTLCSFKIMAIARPRSSVGDPEVVREIFMLDATQAATGQSNGILQASG